MSIYDKASLVLIPSGTKTSKVYSQKPTNGDGDFTFSRSTAATRVNASGNIEKETQNLLLQSNQFDTTWNSVNVTMTGGQSGYDGTSDAWELDSTAGSLRQTISQSGVFTFSCYAKAGTAPRIRFRLNASTDANCYIDLSNGVGTHTGIDLNVTDIGSGWYRIALSHNDSALSDIRIYATDSSDFPTTGSVFIQDAQLEQGLVARDYIETTTSAIYGGITDNVPRLDYTDSSCPALLLEPQRSNLVPFSEHLESSDWAKTRCTIEDNSTTSPEGVINASKMTSTDASESYIQDNLTTTGTKVTWSFFAKKGDLDYAHGLVWDRSASGCRQWFNLSTGAVGGTTTFGSGYSVDSATIEDYGNGWYRCAMVVNSTAGTQGCRLNISSADTTIGSAVNSYGYFYGIQFEDASYATSYIPTYGSAVTRNQDLCYITNLKNDVTTGATEGSIMIDFTREGYHSTGDAVQVYGDTTNGRGYVYNTGVGFAANWGLAAHNISYGTDYKILYRLNTLSTGNIFLNGSKSSDASGTSWGSINAIYLRGSFGTLKIRQVLVLTTALSDADAIDLTT